VARAARRCQSTIAGADDIGANPVSDFTERSLVESTSTAASGKQLRTKAIIFSTRAA